MRRKAWFIAGALVVGAGAIALLHVNGAHALSMLGGCPIEASASDVERARMHAIAKKRGTARAAKRPAAGFVLDVTTPEDVHAWAEAHRLACRSSRGGMLVACTAVPASALGDRPEAKGSMSEVDFAFRPKDRTLVNVALVTFGMDAAPASAALAAAKLRLDRALGPSTTAEGDRSTAHFVDADFATATLTYRCADVVAEVSATKLASKGILLREHYVSAVD